jgi:acyl-CoA synthetase (AMP-forming)/AMP-acid ligase II/3-oxoacyl-(acyl-carrier-protein) synthase/acyl carrier protein
MAANLSIAALIAQHAAQKPQAPALSFLRDGHPPATLTFGQLDARARAVATTLRNQGLSGEPVLVVCPPGLDYVCSLVGAWYAGAIPVPAYPPAASGVTRMAERITALATDARASAALTTSAVDASAIDVREHVLVDRIAVLSASPFQGPQHATDDPCLLQYTSGSTGSPKGVVISHANLIACQSATQQAARLSASDVVVCWLPPYHDMGLIGGIVLPLYLGAHCVLMAPDAFIRRPRRWLQAIGDFGASVSMVPNFALDLCVGRIPAAQREGLELSSMRVLFCGAEPIQPASVEAFTAAFAPHGLSRAAIFPAYGLAETTLMVSGGSARGAVGGAAPLIRGFDAEALTRGEVRRAEAEATTLRMVGCGRATPGTQLRIVDPATRRCVGPGRVGEIWVANAAVARGYLRRPDETRDTFGAYLTDTAEGPFLRTGDLGFLQDGELFIAGRIKDLIIIRGKNHYPSDLEHSVQEVDPALIAGCGVAFSVDDAGSERLVIVQELDHRLGREPAELVPRIAQALSEHHQLLAREIVLVKKGSLPKTSSGKLQRRETRACYLEGRLVVPERARRATMLPPAPEAPGTQAAAEAPGAEPPARLLQFLRERLAGACGLAPDALDPDAPLTRYGIDSLTATELADELSRRLGREIPSTVVYDHPTLRRLVQALTAGPVRAAPAPAPEPGPRGHASEPIAIVGMACRVPGANDLRGFWQLLRNGVDAITEVPPERWDNARLYDPNPAAPGKISSRWGGFVEAIDRFDHEFFGVAQREAERMDPQQRLFLETTWEALEDAGLAITNLAGTDVGVFAAAATGDYALLYRGALQHVDADYGTGNASSVIANRVSYVLGTTGPSMTFDTACSSSLVAIQAACRSLQHGDSTLCVVGGVNAILSPESSIFFSKARALAADGRCKSFDATADGFVRGEGCGVIVLKRLSEALADGDRVYALVAGSAVNHSGTSNGMLAPNGPAQQRLIQSALRDAGIRPGEVDYVEAHGVGTPVADVVEARALGEVMRSAGRTRPCLVGSVKTNIGHLEAASGLVSVIKAALALTHEEIPPNLHLNDVHPEIERAQLPLSFPTVPTAWSRRAGARYAGVSAFGFGGCNAHVVLAEAPLRVSPLRLESAGQDRERRLFTLSARSTDALVQLARRHAQRLPPSELADICFTANTGRAHFEHRLAVVAADHEELRAALGEFVALPSRSAVAPTRRQPRIALLFGDRRAEPGADGPEADRRHFAQLRRRFERLRLCAIEPALVWGIGVGEYAAACAAGALDWDDAERLVSMRAEVLRSLVPGGMVTRSIHELTRELAGVEFAPLACAFVSGMLERVLPPGEVIAGAHFRSHLYETPGERDGQQLLAAEALDVRVELDAGATDHSMLEAIAACYVQGASLDLRPLYAGEARCKVSLPSYPFRRTRCWLPFAEPAGPVSAAEPRRGPITSTHPLLQRARELTAGTSGFLRKTPEDQTG